MKKQKKIVAGTIVLLIILFGITFITNKMTSYIVEDETPDIDWLVDNCECIERENLKCDEGFELFEEERLCKRTIIKCPSEIVLDIEGICKSEKQYTNVLLGCSKYNCTGEIYEIE